MSIEDSRFIPVTAVAAFLAERGIRTTTKSVYRWTTAGCRGRVLATVRVAGRSYSTVAALEVFVEIDRDQAVGHRSRPSERARRAGEELERLGL